MTDKKLTDNEIIKALEVCSDGKIGNEDCINCPYNYIERERPCCDCLMLDALDLITHQKTENENLKVENQSLRTAANSLKMHYEEAQAEIERLEKETEDKERAYNDEFCLRKEWKAKCQELLEEKQTAKSEVINEFAERLKNEIINDTAYACDSTQHSGYYDYQIKICDIPEYIDNLVKEMVGESNDS